MIIGWISRFPEFILFTLEVRVDSFNLFCDLLDSGVEQLFGRRPQDLLPTGVIVREAGLLIDKKAFRHNTVLFVSA